MDWAFRPAYYTDYGTWVDITAPGGDAYTAPGENGRNYAEVLSTILCDDAINYKDGRKYKSLYGYGFMQGTSMACPHVSGVAALGLSYAAQLGRQYTVGEFKSLLLSSVYGIDRYFTGTKVGITVPDLSEYRGKMGGGCVDALKMLLAVRGTTALLVPTGESATVDLAGSFGGSQSVITLTSAELDSPSNLGLTSATLSLDGSRITLTCPKQGVSILRVVAVAGDVAGIDDPAGVGKRGGHDSMVAMMRRSWRVLRNSQR